MHKALIVFVIVQSKLTLHEDLQLSLRLKYFNVFAAIRKANEKNYHWIVVLQL